MAQPPTSAAQARSFKARPRRSMSPRQLQAYLVARETLRRLRRSSAPCIPPDPQIWAHPARDCQPASGRP